MSWNPDGSYTIVLSDWSEVRLSGALIAQYPPEEIRYQLRRLYEGMYAAKRAHGQSVEPEVTK